MSLVLPTALEQLGKLISGLIFDQGNIAKGGAVCGAGGMLRTANQGLS